MVPDMRGPKFAVAGPRFTAAVQVELDCSGVTLVHQARDLGLEHDRAAKLLGRVGRGLLTGDQPRGDLGYPVAHEQLGSLQGGQPPTVG
jgi:hypothetical protein